jgi:hypothetical protein
MQATLKFHDFCQSIDGTIAKYSVRTLCACQTPLAHHLEIGDRRRVDAGRQRQVPCTRTFVTPETTRERSG